MVSQLASDEAEDRNAPVSIVHGTPPLDRGSAVPIFAQVQARLQQAITSGELAPHQRIPSERELSQALGVSRMTVRQALRGLTGDGALYTRSGKGTFVADRKLEQPLQRLSSFTEDIASRGMRPSSRVLTADVLAAPIELAQALDIRPGSELVRIRRLRLADGSPMALETSHLPHVICPGLLQHDLAKQSLYEILRESYGVDLRTARQTIEASPPTREERTLLGLPPGVPVLRIHRITSTSDGRVCEFVRAAYRGDRYQLHVELR